MRPVDRSSKHVSDSRVIVEDVRKSPIFAGTPALEVMLAARARAVQSTPLVTRSARLLGKIDARQQLPPFIAQVMAVA